MNVFRGVTKNRLFMGIIGITFILQVNKEPFVFLFINLILITNICMLYHSTPNFQIVIIEFLGKFASTVRLDWKLWLVSLIIGLVRLVRRTLLAFNHVFMLLILSRVQDIYVPRLDHDHCFCYLTAGLLL